MIVKFSGKQLETARLAADMSREDLAFEARRHTARKVSSRAIRGYEKGEYVPGSDVLAALAIATRRDIEFFHVAEGDASDGVPFPGSLGRVAGDVGAGRGGRVGKARGVSA